jgi:dipeptidyl-peptidase-3
MKLLKISALLLCAALLNSCQKKTEDTFDVKVERFADLQILRYEVPLDNLSPKQKELVYYLSQAALCGRDIIYAQNFKYNIQIRRSLENIYTNYSGDKSTDDWGNFEVYLKRIWFSNGIHHHYAEKKIMPDFSEDYLRELIGSTEGEWPVIEGESSDSMWNKLFPVIFDKNVAAKKVVKDEGVDKIAVSANNYYGEGITTALVDSFYKPLLSNAGDQPVEYGLNSRLVWNDGRVEEKVYKIGGLYTEAIEKAVEWLEKAVGVAENDNQKKHLELLVEYYKTGDLSIWDKTNIQWVKSTEGDIDFIHGFIEVYGDALGFRAAYESVIEVKDFDASQRMKVLADNVQWFEDNAPLMDEHKKDKVVGVSYKVVNVAMEAGDAAPSTPIGINLPNNNWIRTNHGSKSVSLGNIVQAYNDAGGSGVLEEFALTDEQKERAKKYGKLAGKMHTAMHEVIGHASGKLNPGVGTPKETLKNYSNTLEEARADLVGLYYIMDEKIVELGLVPSLEVGKAEYDGYIRNGLMTQLKRLEPGENIEEDHMRNRQLVAAWAMEKGADENVIEKKVVEGKTYFVVNDYEKLRELFGQLLREIQRIKSEGDYEAGKNLVETYGIKVDQELLAEVHKRYEKLDLAPYSGFIQPMLEPVIENGEFKDLKVKYESSFAEQMLRYSKEYSFLPNYTN